LASDALDTEAGSNYGIDYTPIKNYAYYYRYDTHGNCIEKKLPGADLQYMVYDKADRLVLSQDGNQRLKNRWMFTKYDAFGRRIMYGSIILPSSTTHASLLSTYKNMLVTESYNGSTTTWGYTDTYFPSASREGFYEINYYDHYKFLSTAGIPGSRTSYMGWQPSEKLDDYYSTSAKGMLTGTINVVTCNFAMRKYTAYYYDKKGRVVQKNGVNYFNPGSNYTFGKERYAYSYDFKGNLLKVHHRQNAVYNGPTYLEGTINEYDHADRCTKTKHFYGSANAAVTTSIKTYNDLGQLATKTYGSGLETQTYTYNVRGWLKNISGNLFSEDLYYEKRRDGNTAGLYNGNICQTSWKYLTGAIHDAGWQSNVATWKSNQVDFFYTYDNLNRMTIGGRDGDLTSFGEQLEYDKHGNIKAMTRGGIIEHGWVADGITPNHYSDIVDELVFNYNGNQLNAVTDYASWNQNFTGGQDFKDYTGEEIEYNYDQNGNMTTNLNKNIATIKYNFLNLSDTVQMRNGDNLYTVWSSSGEKFRTTHRIVSGSTVTIPVGSTLSSYATSYKTSTYTMTDYYDNFIYEKECVSQIMLEDGYLFRSNMTSSTVPTSTPTFTYHYYLKDHLGNNRVVLHDAGDATPVVDQVNNYYPFGMEYGESANDQDEMTYQDRLFSDKEFDRSFELNMYDFGAREYDNMRFMTMDPHAENYYSISPYAYCGNNPINKIDPTGMDEWDIDSLGSVVNHTVTDKHDAFYIVDAERKRVEEKSITYTYGTVKDYGTKTANVVDEKTGETRTYSYDYYSIEGDENAKVFFEFMANPGITTKVEWSRLAYGEEGSQGVNNLTTTHQEKMEAGGMSLYYDRLQNAANVRLHIHNHPDGMTSPGVSDVKNAAVPIQLDYPDAKMYIYIASQVYKLYYGIYPLKPVTIRPR
jgi:RHS repeat-associated protein